MINITAFKEKFISLLKSTERKGVDETIKYLEDSGFFEAPASTQYHGAYPGGLLEHSYNVYLQALYIYKIECKIKPQIKDALDEKSIIIASLLHDVCKAEVYKEIKKWRKDETKPAGKQWEQYDTWKHTYDDNPFGHGEKSVIVLLHKRLIELTEEEMLAIRWHMGAWDLSTYPDARKSFDSACDKTPLVPIIIAADTLASRAIEVRGEVKEEEKKETEKKTEQ